MKARYIGETDDLIFIHGKEYEVDCILVSDCYVVIDEVGDPTVWGKDEFELVDCTEEELDVYGPDPTATKIVLERKGIPRNK